MKNLGGYRIFTMMMKSPTFREDRQRVAAQIMVQRPAMTPRRSSEGEGETKRMISSGKRKLGSFCQK
jgi:hypothetical protein